jgi:competence protein ComEC
VETFRACGTAHLVAISGLHLGLLALFLVPPLRWTLGRFTGFALAHPLEPVARASALPALIAYGGLAGFQPSTLRALAMTGLVLIATATSRPAAALPLLSATALLLGLADPTALADPGLHLSFAALAGLFWLAPALERRLSRQRPALETIAPPSARVRWSRAAGRGACRIFCASAGATLATAPFVAYHFGGASPLGLVANPLAVPIVGFFCLPLGLGGVALHPLFPAAGQILWAFAGRGLSALLWLQGVLAPLATPLQTPSLESVWGLGAGCCLVSALVLALASPPRRRTAGFLLAAGFVGTLLPVPAGYVRGLLRQGTALWVFDVGQGQAIGVSLPGGAWALVDGGGSPGGGFDMGERVVVPALRALGCRRLALVVSTHPHPDHVEGLVAALRWGQPAELWLPGGFTGDPRYAPLLEAAAAAGTRALWVPTQGNRTQFGETSLEARWFPGSTENDRSLVVWVRCRSTTALLPADLEIAGQQRLMASGIAVDCDLLLAPHHGSANALFPPFLTAASPAVVIASAGGRPGLPAQSFVNAVQAVGAQFRATHREGCLRARLGPGGLFVAAAVD